MRVLSFSRRGLSKAIADPSALTDEVVLRSSRSAPAFVACMRDVALGPPASATQPRCPTLAIWGERDGLLTVKDGRAIAADLGAELVVLPGIAHLPQREAPEETARRIRGVRR
jgi:pimeloyl-ACP methyl ester carboxylesterase